MKRYWVARGIKFFLMFLLFFAVVSFATMWLWNNLLITIFTTLPVITYWQALGIMILGRLIFGFGHHGGWHGGSSHHSHWKSRMAEKWKTMTPEEREKMRSEWRSRCGKWYGHYDEKDKDEEKQAQQL